MALKVIIPPAVEPLSLVEAKQHLRVDNTDDDALITSLIIQAREYCEGYQNRKYITQTLETVLDKFPGIDYFNRRMWTELNRYPHHNQLLRENYIEFANCSPLQSVISVKYYGADGTEYLFDSANYIVDTDSFVHRLALAYNISWTDTTLQPINAVRIRFVCGYGDTSSAVPESVKWAMVLQMKLLYDDYLPLERAKLEDARDALLTGSRVSP